MSINSIIGIVANPTSMIKMKIDIPTNTAEGVAEFGTDAPTCSPTGDLATMIRVKEVNIWRRTIICNNMYLLLYSYLIQEVHKTYF